MRLGCVRLVLVLVGVVVLVVACGGGDGDAGGDVGGEPVVSVTSVPGVDAGVVVEPVVSEPVSEPVAEVEVEPVDGVVVEPVGGSEGVVVVEPVVSVPVGVPFVARLPWGDFELSERVVGRLDGGERLRFVLSVESVGGGVGELLGDGWVRAAGVVSEVYGVDVDARVVGPLGVDAGEQAAVVESLLLAGDVDCLVVQAANPGLMDGVIDLAVGMGVPVFAVGGDSPGSRRFAFFGVDDFGVGEAVGLAVGEWAVEGSILVRVAGLVAGDAGDQGSYDLMRGFVDGFGVVHSGVVWVNGPGSVDSVGFDAVGVRAATEAWVLENSDVDVVFHADAGVEVLASVMADQFLYGDMYAVGFHMSPVMVDFIRERLVAAAVVARYFEQGRLAGEACGDFLLGGVLETGHVVVEPLIVTRDNVEETDWSQPENL